MTMYSVISEAAFDSKLTYFLQTESEHRSEPKVTKTCNSFIMHLQFNPDTKRGRTHQDCSQTELLFN